MKGSIRFNAAVNAEVTTDGTQITRCVNLVDGSELVPAGAAVLAYTGSLSMVKSGSGSVTVSFLPIDEDCETVVPDYDTINTTAKTFTDLAIINGKLCLRQQSIATPVVTGDGAASFQNITKGGKYFTVIEVADPTAAISVVF